MPPNVSPETLFKEAGAVIGFFLLFSPGFVTLTVYHAFTAAEPRKISDVVYEILGYGCLTYAVTSPYLLWFFYDKTHFTNYGVLDTLLIVELIVVPVAFAGVALTRDWLADKGTSIFVHTKKLPWDYVFAKGQCFAAVITLIDGGVIGGLFSEKGFASHFPFDQQILLDERWELDSENRFVRKTPGTQGVMVLIKDIRTLEMYDVALVPGMLAP